MKKYIKNLNWFILIILFLLGFSVLYFLYFRIRNQAEVFVGLSVTRGTVLPANVPYNWVPYWLDQAINPGDREVSPLGGVTATILDKESYEASFYGRNVYLLLSMNAIRDRSGIYLFKNKPLSVGAQVDLKLTRAQINGLVTYIGTEKPKHDFKKLLVKLVGLNEDIWMADNLKIGSIITDNKGTQIGKIIGKLVSTPHLGSTLGISDPSKRKLELTVEILAKKIDDNYYYSETQKVKVDENLFLPFKEVSLNLPVASVVEIQ